MRLTVPLTDREALDPESAHEALRSAGLLEDEFGR